jgi:ribosomal protein S11
MGGGDFTIEGWFYLTNPTYAQGMFHVNATAITGTNAGYAVGITSSGVIQYYAGTTFTNASATISANTWTHIAMVRSSGTVKVFVNGVLPSSGGSIADSQNVASATAYIGLFYSTPGANYAMTGYIDDFRITKGYARYTTTFTPPAAALPTY